MTARAPVLALLAALVACQERPLTPEDTVRLYFARLGRDPIRTLSLLTEDFHLRHGLPPVRVRDEDRRRPRAARRPRSLGLRAPPASSPESERARSVDGHRIGWLNAQTEGELRTLAPQLRTSLLAAERGAERVRLDVRVELPERAPFTQRFELVRGDADGAWRIDAIEQLDVGPGRLNLTAAYAAYPTEETRRRLERLGRRRR